jgi:hypothetical protein
MEEKKLFVDWLSQNLIHTPNDKNVIHINEIVKKYCNVYIKGVDSSYSKMMTGYKSVVSEYIQSKYPDISSVHKEHKRCKGGRSVTGYIYFKIV